MAAAVTESKVSRSLTSDSLVYLKTISKSVCLLLVLCVLLGTSSADSVYEMEEFLKREYSLTKPYQGSDHL